MHLEGPLALCPIFVPCESVTLHKEYGNLLGNVLSFINKRSMKFVAALTSRLDLKVLSDSLTDDQPAFEMYIPKSFSSI